MKPVSTFLCDDYTHALNTFSDARALFERAVNAFPADKARPIWDRWTRYEYQYGTLEASHLLEKRMAEVYPQGSSDRAVVAIYLTLSRPAYQAFRGTLQVSGLRHNCGT